MRVAVEVGRLEDLREERVGDLRGELVLVEAALLDLGDVGELERVDEFHREDALVGRLPVDVGDADVVDADVGEALLEARRVLALERVVDLFVEQLGGLLVVDVGERSAPSDFGSNLSSSFASTFKFLRSVSKSALRPARCTFTATGLPLYVARWTWPRDAVAIGTFSKVSKIWPIGLPNSVSMIETARSPPKPGTLSAGP